MQNPGAASGTSEGVTAGSGSDLDELGAAQELNDQLTLASLRLARSGRIFDLSNHLSPQSPRLPEQTPYVSSLSLNPGTGRAFYEAQGAVNGVAFAEERVELSFHTGTHIDALGHTWANDKAFRGKSLSEAIDIWGLKQLGIETLPPIITRGVVLDLPRLLDRELSPGEVITERDLQAVLERAGLGLRPGDVVLLRTGWSRYYEVDNERFLSGWPGIGLAAAQWLVQQRVVAIGSDTMGLEVYPGERSDVLYPVHEYLLVHSGTYIIEQAALEEITEAEVTEFLCLCLAPKFRGGTGAPVRLVAVV